MDNKSKYIIILLFFALNFTYSNEAAEVKNNKLNFMINVENKVTDSFVKMSEKEINERKRISHNMLITGCISSGIFISSYLTFLGGSIAFFYNSLSGNSFASFIPFYIQAISGPLGTIFLPIAIISLIYSKWLKNPRKKRVESWEMYHKNIAIKGLKIALAGGIIGSGCLTVAAVTIPLIFTDVFGMIYYGIIAVFMGVGTLVSVPLTSIGLILYNNFKVKPTLEVNYEQNIVSTALVFKIQ